MESKTCHKCTYLQNRNRVASIENRLTIAKAEGGWGGMDREFGFSSCKLVCIGWINNKVLLYSTGNYMQYSVKKHNVKAYVYVIYMCVCKSLFCIVEIKTTL